MYIEYSQIMTCNMMCYKVYLLWTVVQVYNSYNDVGSDSRKAHNIVFCFISFCAENHPRCYCEIF